MGFQPAARGLMASNLQHMHMACGLFAPGGAERGTYGTAYRLGDRFRIAPAPTRHRLESFHRRIVSDLLDPLP